jgi:Uma2 family endonuclease
MTATGRHGGSCHAVPDGMTLRVDETTAFEPDAAVYRGEEMDAAPIEVPSPVIVAEVLSPATRHVDLPAKLAGYPRVPGSDHPPCVRPATPS